MKKLKKNPSGPSSKPIEDGDTVILHGPHEVQVVKAKLVHDIAEAFRRHLGKRDASGYEVDLSAVGDDVVIMDVVCTLEGVERANPDDVTKAMAKFWLDPLEFAQRALKQLAH